MKKQNSKESESTTSSLALTVFNKKMEVKASQKIEKGNVKKLVSYFQTR